MTSNGTPTEPAAASDASRRDFVQLMISAKSSGAFLQVAVQVATVGGLSTRPGNERPFPEAWTEIRDSDDVAQALSRALTSLISADDQLNALSTKLRADCFSQTDLSALVRLIDEWADTIGWLLVLDQLAEIGANYCGLREGIVPGDIAQLLVGLAAPPKGGDILDLRAGNGTLLTRSFLHVARSGEACGKLVGYELNAKSRSLAYSYALIAGVQNIEFRQSASAIAPQHKYGTDRPEFETVLACPPLWRQVSFLRRENSTFQFAHSPQDDSLLDPEAFPLGMSEHGDLIAVQDAFLSLKPGGRAAVIVSLKALCQDGTDAQIREALLDEDLIEAVVQLGPALWYDTQVPCCVVLGRGHGTKPAERKGKLIVIDASSRHMRGHDRNKLGSRDIAAIVDLVERFEDAPGQARVFTRDTLKEAGFLVPRRIFERERYEELLHKRFDEVAHFGLLGQVFRFRSMESGKAETNSTQGLLFELPPIPDSTLYIQRTDKVVRVSTEEPFSNLRQWYRLDAKSASTSAEFYCHFLNSELGERGLISQTNDGSISSLTPGLLQELLVPIPKQSHQDQYHLLHRRIEDIITTAEELRYGVINNPHLLPQISASVEALDTGNSQERWCMSLPFPLASILRRYQTASEARDKQDSGIRFLEAVVQFVAMYDLSCFYEATQETKHLAPVGKLLPDLDKKRLLTGGIGSWFFVHEKLAEMLRKGDHEDALRDGLDGRFVDILKRLANAELGKLFRRAAEIKNIFKSHDAIASESEYTRQTSVIETEIQSFREQTIGLFDELQVVRQLRSIKTAGVRRVTVDELRGSDPTFNQRVITSDHELDSALLYAVVTGGTNPLPLVPLIKMAHRPKFSQDACYFFSRISGGANVSWVSHHFRQDARIQDDGGSLPRAMEDIFPSTTKGLPG